MFRMGIIGPFTCRAVRTSCLPAGSASPAVQYSTVQDSTVQYSTVHLIWPHRRGEIGEVGRGVLGRGVQELREARHRGVQ